MLHNQVKLPRSFDDLIELDDIWVLHLLQNLNFSCDSVDVCLVLYFGFLQYFDSNSLTRDRLNSKFYLSKSAFAQSFLDHEMRYLFELFFNWFVRLIRGLAKYVLLKFLLFSLKFVIDHCSTFQL